MKELNKTYPTNPSPTDQIASTPVSNFARFRAKASRIGLDDFLLALILSIVLAYVWPEGGIPRGSFSLAAIANFGVSVIFFFYGLKLSPAKLQAGLRNWRLHMVIQLATFVLFPVIVLVGQQWFGKPENQTLWLGAFYLAALPSTVSSSVVMVSIAGGNIPAAIFNASISSLIGVFVTPLWMGWFLSIGSGTFDLTGVIIKLMIQVLLPVLLGILLHSRWGTFAEKHRIGLRYFDQAIILLIVYTSFCESFSRQLFKGYGLADIALLGLWMLSLFFGVYGIIYLISRAMGFIPEDRIAATFCGSKKSLVQGTIMAKVLFAGSASVGIILLPIMLYHALQLVAVSVMAQRIAANQQQKAGSV